MQLISNLPDESDTSLKRTVALVVLTIVMEAVLAIMMYEKSVMLFEMGSGQSSFWATIAALVAVFAGLVVVLNIIRLLFGCTELYRRFTKARMKGERTLSNT